MEKVKYSENIKLLFRKIDFIDNNDMDFFETISMDSILFVRLILEVESKFGIEYLDECLSLVSSSSISQISEIIDYEITQKKEI